MGSVWYDKQVRRQMKEEIRQGSKNKEMVRNWSENHWVDGFVPFIASEIFRWYTGDCSSYPLGNSDLGFKCEHKARCEEVGGWTEVCVWGQPSVRQFIPSKQNWASPSSIPWMQVHASDIYKNTEVAGDLSVQHEDGRVTLPFSTSYVWAWTS